MSSPRDFDTDDEIVSRVLDGEATADERARVTADPALASRLATFRAVAQTLAEPVAAADAARNSAVAAAMAATEPRAAPVIRLGGRRRSTRWLNAAAIVAAAAAIIVALAMIIPGRSNSGATKFDEVGQSIGGAEASAPGGPPSTAAAVPTTPYKLGTSESVAGSFLGDLGTFATSADIATALTTRLGGSAAVTTTIPAPSAEQLSTAEQSCASTRAGSDAALGTLTAVGDAVVAGRAVEVLVFSDGHDVVRGLLVDPASCTAVGGDFAIGT